MASRPPQHLNFVLIPFMAPGHIIPMIDMAKLLAKHGADVTIIVTHVGAARFSSVLNRAFQSGLSIRLLKIRFPCGWNSTVEGICSGLPMITWPMFAEQYFNEKLVLQIVETGVGVGVKGVAHLGEEEKPENKVMRDGIEEAVRRVMDEREEGCERRKKAREVGEMAKRSVEEGGSSFLNVNLLIQDIEQYLWKNLASYRSSMDYSRGV